MAPLCCASAITERYELLSDADADSEAMPRLSCLYGDEMPAWRRSLRRLPRLCAHA